MLTRLAKWWLYRRNYEIHQPLPIFCLMVSGHAIAYCEDEDGTVWKVIFPRKPNIIARWYSYVDTATPSEREARTITGTP
jgi:hypothetical protein